MVPFPHADRVDGRFLGANIWLDHADGFPLARDAALQPRCELHLISNTSRLAFLGFSKNCLPATPLDAVREALKAPGRSLSSQAANARSKTSRAQTLKKSLGDRAELSAAFKDRPADGLSRSGDPMADRAGFKLMNVPDDNLGDLVKRA